MITNGFIQGTVLVLSPVQGFNQEALGVMNSLI